MPGSSSNVRAGGAFVELFAKDVKLRKSLQRAQATLRNFGNGVKAIGAKMFAVGAAIRAPFEVAEGVFTSLGTEMLRMSERSGVSVESLSQIGYAAKQNGVELETLENGFKKLSNKLGEAEQGNGAAILSFAKLRVSIGQLKGMSPDQQFELIADRISKIQDPAQRAAIAIELFGKSGTQLLPMMQNGAAGIEKLRKEAEELGLTMSTADAVAAEGFSKKMGTLGDVVKMAAFNVGGALVPQLVSLVGIVTKYAAKASAWIKQNSGLVVSVAKIASAIAGAGIAIYALGSGFSLIASGIGIVSATLGILASPFVAIPLAVGGAVFAFVKFTDAGQKLWAQVKAFLAPIGKIFETTFGGIKDAISGGRLDLAAKIAFLGVKAAMLQGIASLSDAVGGDLGDFIGALTSQIADGNFAGAWSAIVSGMSVLWAKFSESIVSVFTSAAKLILSVWSNVTGRIAEYMREQIESGTVLGKAIEGKFGEAAEKAIIPQGGFAKRAMEIQEKEKEKAAHPERNILPDDPATKASDIIAGEAKKMIGGLDAVQDQAAANTKTALARLAGAGGKGRAADRDAVDAARKELADAIATAKAEAKKHGPQNLEAQQGAKDGQDAALAAVKQSAAGTYSGLTAGRQLGAANPVVAELRIQRHILQKIEKHAADGGGGGFF